MQSAAFIQAATSGSPAIDKAITAHRAEQRRKPYPTRAEDLNLYRRVNEILGDRV